MPKVMFIDTQAHLYDTLKRKFEYEGFEVIAEEQNEQPDLIVVGRNETILAGPHLNIENNKNIPIIMLSKEAQEEDLSQYSSVSHLKMPFRPSQLMALARQAVALP